MKILYPHFCGCVWVAIYCSFLQYIKVERQLWCTLEQGRVGSGSGVHLFMCPWEGNAVRLCWQQRQHPCSAPQQEKREERGQLRKRADMGRNKPVIAPDFAYTAKSITTPVNRPSILLAPISQFRFRMFQRTQTEWRHMTATWGWEAFRGVSLCYQCLSKSLFQGKRISHRSEQK